jgi:hypothetical protein
MIRRMHPLAWLSLAAVALSARAGEPGDYLSKDGRLAQRLEVRDVRGGFAGFTGRQWTVEPSGKWTVHRVRNKPVEVEASGQLAKEQMEALAKELARYGLRDLPSSKPKRPMANPRVVRIKFGKHTATLELGPAEPLPGVDPERPRATVAGRYAGLLGAVTKLLPPKNGEGGKK